MAVPHYQQGNYLEVVEALCNSQAEIPKQPSLIISAKATTICAKILQIIKYFYTDDDKVRFLLNMIIRVLKQVNDWGNIPEDRLYTYPLELTRNMIKEYSDRTIEKYLSWKKMNYRSMITELCVVHLMDRSRIGREIKRYAKKCIQKRIVLVEGSPILFCIFKGDVFDRIEFVPYDKYCSTKVDTKTFHEQNLLNYQKYAHAEK